MSKFAREAGAGGGGTTTSASDKQDLTSYFVSYDFKFAKFTLGGHSYKATNTAGADTADNAGMNLAADVPLSSALTLTANLQKLDDKLAGNVDSTMTGLGVQYALSKRSVTYARYIIEKADNAGAAVVKDASRLLVACATTSDLTLAQAS